VTRRRPRIGITVSYASATPELFVLRDDYVRAIEAAGGLPFVLAPGKPAHVGELLDNLDAIVLSGGGDVDPRRYGAEPHPTVTTVVPDRDAFEIALCLETLRRDVPLLAICRGQQVLNVATGGTLVQDLPSELAGAADHDPPGERWEPAHEVEVLPGTRLREILGRDRVAVNSFHHQAVRDLGRGLVVSAYGVDDRVVEGVEMPDRRFAVAVQWHPEAFWDQGGAFQPLFEALAAATRG
jgi:putative glutamine amidotransferase